MFTTHKLMGAGGVGGSDPYWITVAGSSANELIKGIAQSSSGDVYIAGNTNTTGTYQAIVAKFGSSDGVFQWAKSTTYAAAPYNSSDHNDIYPLSSGNLIISGLGEVSSNNRDWYIKEVNPSGVVQWGIRLAGGNSDYGYGISVDSSGNIYCAGISNINLSLSGNLVKLSSSGTLQWQRSIGVTSTWLRSTEVGSSGNVYALGYTDNVSGTNYCLVAKWNASGVLQWQRLIQPSTGASYDGGLVIDASENIYVGLSLGGAGSVMKFNSSGVLQWQKTISNTIDVTSVSLSGTGIFFHGNSTTSGNYAPVVGEMDYSGNVIWSNRFIYNSTPADTYTTKVKITSKGDICLSMNTYATGAGGIDTVVARLPPDGTGTGSYGGLNYAAFSVTSSNSSATILTSSLSEGSANLSASSYNGTDTTLVLSELNYPITP